MTDELSEIAQQLAEQLKFYREIGVTHLEHTSAAPPLSIPLGKPAPSSSGRRETPGAAETKGTKPPGKKADVRATPDQQQPAPPTPVAVTNIAPTMSTPPPSGDPVKDESPIVTLFGELPPEPDRRLKPVANAPLPPVLDLPLDPSLDAIREDIGDCTRCKLHKHRTHIVFGEGSPSARLVFVGEGPGADEDASGRPFVGRAGQLLTKIIEGIQMRREDVYICNAVKCRPPGNRTPEPDETSTCEPFLVRQLKFIQPKVIVALGAPAFQTLLHTTKPIGKSRGNWHEWNGIKVMPTWHPAYVLRTPDKKRDVWEDMKIVRDFLQSE